MVAEERLGDLRLQALSVQEERLTTALNSDEPERALRHLVGGSETRLATYLLAHNAAVQRGRQIVEALGCDDPRAALIRMIDDAATTTANGMVDAATATSTPVLPSIAANAASSEVVQTKLANPGLSLSPAESRECLVSCIHHGKAVARRAEGKRIVVVLGNTGAGKSALINLLHGCTFAYEGRMVVARGSAVPELMAIGHTNQSATFTPQVEDASSSVGDGVARRLPGFLDNRGFEINVANAVNVKHTAAAARSAVVVVVINYASLLADRGKGVHDLLAILLGLFGSVRAVGRTRRRCCSRSRRAGGAPRDGRAAGARRPPHGSARPDRRRRRRASAAGGARRQLPVLPPPRPRRRLVVEP